MDKLDRAILKYIPKHHRCRFEEQKREFRRQKEKREIMDSNPLGLSIEIVWTKEDPDMSVCRSCENVVYGPKYRMTINMGGDIVEPARPVVLCEPCYMKNNDQ